MHLLVLALLWQLLAVPLALFLGCLLRWSQSADEPAAGEAGSDALLDAA